MPMLSHRAGLIILILLPPMVSGCRLPSTRECTQSPTIDSDCHDHLQARQLDQPSHSPEVPADNRVMPVAYDEGPLAEELPIPAEAAGMETELSLDRAIRLTLTTNPDLVSASEQVAIADATLARARAEFYPKLGVSEQYGVSNNPVTAFSFQLNQAQLSFNQDFNNPGTIDDFHTQLRLQHSLYAGQRTQHSMHAAQAQVSAAASNVEGVQNQLVFRVAEAYYRLLQARNLVKVREEAVSQVEQHLKIVESRFRNETAVKSDVLTIEVRLAEVRESLISTRNQLHLAWAVIENVIGSRIESRGLPATIPPAPWNDHASEVEAAVNKAFDSRPEVEALASQRQAAAEGTLVAEAGKRLAVDLVADYDVFTGDFRRGNDGFFVGLVFHLNLFDGGRTRAEVSQALARVREVQARQQRLMLDIELDVRRAYLQLRDAEARIEVATQAIEQAGESLREIEVRYRGQTASITLLVDAQVALSNARVRRTTAQADIEISRASLERAVGQLTSALAL